VLQNVLTDFKAKQEIKLCHNCLYSNDSCLDVLLRPGTLPRDHTVNGN